MSQQNIPALTQVIQSLRNGYWDQTKVIELADGRLCVRKISKGQNSAGPWGGNSLRTEILYLANLEVPLRDFFPSLLAHWDGNSIGYDMSFLSGFVNVGEIAQRQLFTQAQANAMQDYLAKRLFSQIHTRSQQVPVLRKNVEDTLLKAQHSLATHPQLRCLLKPIIVNGQALASLPEQLKTLQSGNLLARLDAEPQVRLHGDLFLENMLLPETDCGDNWPQRLILIDPISVAGIGSGHPLFDLAKYESYATGELPAMRQERLILKGFEHIETSLDTENIGDKKTTLGQEFSEYVWAIDWQDEAMAGLSKINWHHRLRSAYIKHYQEIDHSLYALLQAYFAAAMVVCTHGREQQARTLKMRESLALVSA